MYTVHMRRTNLVLDENLLDEATRVLGVKTYSAAVNFALAEALRVKKVLDIPSFFGSGLWEGDLSTLREDRPPNKRSSAQRKRTKK
jgi:hypothetical protein